MLIVFAVLLGLGMALLLLPVLIAVRLDHPGPGGDLRLRLSWGFFLGGAGVQLRLQGDSWHLRPLFLGLGLPFPRLRLGGAPADAPAPDLTPTAAPPPPAAQEEPPPARGPRRAGLGGTGEWLRPLLRLLRRLVGTLRWRRLHLEGSFGLASPAATGQLFGYLQAMRGILPSRLRLDLRPDFVRPGTRGRAQLALHFHLGKALYLVAAFAARLAWRQWGRRRAAGRPIPNSSSPRR